MSLMDALESVQMSPGGSEVPVEVFLSKSATQGFGLNVAGGIDVPYFEDDPSIYVVKVRDGGPAERDGRISVGDRIISVNGRPLTQVTHLQAVATLRGAGAHCVMLIERGAAEAALQAGWTRVPTPRGRWSTTSGTRDSLRTPLERPSLRRADSQQQEEGMGLGQGLLIFACGSAAVALIIAYFLRGAPGADTGGPDKMATSSLQPRDISDPSKVKLPDLTKRLSK